MISGSSSVPAPLLIDDEYLRDDGEEGVQPPRTSSLQEMFVLSCKLFELLGDIPGTFFPHGTGAGSQNELGAEKREADMIIEVYRSERRIHAFSRSIPRHLQYRRGSEREVSNESKRFRLQRQVIYCR